MSAQWFFDDLAGGLAELRQYAEARMVDTFAVMVSTGGWVYDPDAGEDVEEMALLFMTPGYIPPASALSLSAESEVGGRTSLSSKREIRIPWDSDEVPPNAVAICSAVGALTPPRMLGRSYRVGGSDGASQGTACHLEITETLS